jgi:hypothetical protein
MATNLASAANTKATASSGLATERARQRVSLQLVRTQSERRVVSFFALDASVRMVGEADSEDEARSLCREMRWEFIALCED